MNLFDSENEPREMGKYAKISDCEKYRYVLCRTWDEEKPSVLFVMLNPSTADATNDDPTIRRCIGFAKAWGCGSIAVVNLCAFRATSPKDLIAASKAGINIIGEENAKHVSTQVRFHSEDTGSVIVAAWGANAVNPALKEAVRQMLRLLPKDATNCLDKTQDGYPKHPLYCPSGLQLQPFGFWTEAT